jgi:hypothetical protein
LVHVSSQVFPGGTEFLIPFVVVATATFAIVAVVTARRDPDPSGTRPYAVYLSLVLFVALFTALFAATAAVSNAIRIPLKDSITTLIPVGSTSAAPLVHGAIDVDKQHTAGAVQAALIVIAALLVMWFHVGRLRELVQEPRFSDSPGRRTYQVYLHAVSFVSTTILIFAGAAAIYGLFRILAPGTTDQFVPASLERDQGIAQAVSTGLLALLAFAIFRYHWHRTLTLRGAGPAPRRGRHVSPPHRPPERHEPHPPAPEPKPEPEPTPPPDEGPPPVIPPT